MALKCKLMFNFLSTLSFGGLIVVISVVFCSYLTNPTAFVWVYSVCFGIGKGLMYSSVLNAALSHLPNRMGTVSGCVICGIGWGGFIFGIITNRICNPNDDRP